MLLTVDSEEIVGIKMSTLEESQDNQVSALIDDLKKDIQSDVKDDLKVKDEKVSDGTDDVMKLAEGETDIADIKPEIQINGSGEDEIISNGETHPETPNSDKENDAPKVSNSVVKLENNIDNTANSNNSIVDITKNQVVIDNIDTGNDNSASMHNDTAKEDVVKSVIDNMPTINYIESEAPDKQSLENEKKTAEIPNSDNAETPSDIPLENNEQIDAKIGADLNNSMEISAAENTDHEPLTGSESDKSSIVTDLVHSVNSKEHSEENEIDTSQIENDVKEVGENSSKDEVNQSAVVESNDQLELPAETIEKPNETTNSTSLDFNETGSVDKQNKLLKLEEETDVLKMTEKQIKTPSDDDKKYSENTHQNEDIADPFVNNVFLKTSQDKKSSLNDNVKQMPCKNYIESVKQEKTVLTKENIKIKKEDNEDIALEKVVGSTISDVSSTVIPEANSDKQTENEMIVDISQNEPKSEPIDILDSNFSDDKNSNICVKVQKNDESEIVVDSFIVENSVVKNLKDTDCVSVSSMEVDDVEIVPTEKVKTEISKSHDDTMDVSVTNDEDNIIEIFDQDVVESTDNEESEKKKDQPRTPNEEKVDISDEDDIKIVENTKTKPQSPKKEESSVESKPLPVVCKLSNTLDILSDEEDEPPSKVSKVEERKPEPENKQCIDIDDDDDIMLIEDAKEITAEVVQAEKGEQKMCDKVNDETGEKEASKSDEDTTPKTNEEEPIATDIESPKLSEKETSPLTESVKEPSKPLLPINFLKSAKKNLAEMTRDELEEFCILKIVEGIVDRSSLSDIKSKMKNIEKNMEEYKKKAMLLSKQNRDLQVVLKSVQEEQKNRPNSSITPLKITRSVGMQVLMLDKGPKKKPAPQNTNINTGKPITRNMAQPARSQKTPSNNQNIPVPRLIPASPAKSTPSSPITTIAKPQTPNGIRSSVSPALKAAEKRRQAATTNNMTVDLTDDEPPAKVNKSSPVPPVRLVPSQNLMAPLRGQMQTNNQRKVFIPINGQGHTLVRGQTAVMLKSLPQSMGPRQRLPSIPRMASNPVRINLNRHPAPLPDVMKQYQPPTWKALPPAPDLKLSKVENGIVISWKIEGYQEDSYERIASYQLYAYQETSVPPSTALWKKIGDVKALPLPMACTLTQFMAGFKYYFAVRAVDVKSRLGPFSLPGSILLLNKM